MPKHFLAQSLHSLGSLVSERACSAGAPSSSDGAQQSGLENASQVGARVSSSADCARRVIGSARSTVMMLSSLSPSTRMGLLLVRGEGFRRCHPLPARHALSARPSDGSRMPEARRVVAQAAAATPPAQDQPSPALVAKVDDMLNRAQQLEYTNKSGEALQILEQGLSELEQGDDAGKDMAGIMLRQRVSYIYFTQGNYAAALAAAQAVYDSICRREGEDSGEAVIFGLRLGIVEAAAGQLAAGNVKIYRAGSLVAPNLQTMVEQAQQLGQQGGQDAMLRELEVAIQKLVVCLGESNYYGAIFTIKQYLEQGKLDALAGGWPALDMGVRQGFHNLVLALPPGTHSIQNALREHSRMVEELKSHPELESKGQEQAQALQQLVELGPLLMQQAAEAKA